MNAARIVFRIMPWNLLKSREVLVLYRKREQARRAHEHGVFARFRYKSNYRKSSSWYPPEAPRTAAPKASGAVRLKQSAPRSARTGGVKRRQKKVVIGARLFEKNRVVVRIW